MRVTIALGLLAATLAASRPTAAAEALPALRNQARAALEAGRWKEAAALYGRLTERSPDDPSLWRLRALCALRSGACDRAVTACRCALSAGASPPGTWYDIACAEALAGHPGRALDALERAYREGFCNPHLVRDDPDLVSLRDMPRFREIVGWPDSTITDRRERWTRDLRFLARRIREVHWRPFAHISEADFDARLDAIIASIDGRNDLQIRLDVQRLLAAIGDGHTAVTTDFFLMHHDGPSPALRFLPLRLFWYADGVRVIATSDSLRSLAGGRVLGVGGVDISTVLARVDSCVSRDNSWGARWGAMEGLADPKLLAGLELGSPAFGYAFDVERLDGVRRAVTVSAGGPEIAHQLLSLAEIRGLQPGPAGRHKDRLLYMESIARGNVLYVRIDAILDGLHETFAQFTRRIFATADSTHARSLVLDLRDDIGGRGQLALPLLHRIIASTTFNRRGHLFVLAGRKTFSAAMALAAQLELHTTATFVGEPTGSRPNFVGETNRVRLPYSGLWVSVSSLYHQNGWAGDTRFWIPPDLPAGPDFQALLEGRDPALEAVLNFLGADRDR